MPRQLHQSLTCTAVDTSGRYGREGVFAWSQHQQGSVHRQARGLESVESSMSPQALTLLHTLYLWSVMHICNRTRPLYLPLPMYILVEYPHRMTRQEDESLTCGAGERCMSLTCAAACSSGIRRETRLVKRRASLLPRTVILDALSSHKRPAARRSILCRAASLAHNAMHYDTNLHYTPLTRVLSSAHSAPSAHLICRYMSSHITFLIFASALASTLSWLYDWQSWMYDWLRALTIWLATCSSSLDA